ncbi:Eukaryotic translation initiation factor 3 subunit L, partial [Conglomerata obtusa]
KLNLGRWFVEKPKERKKFLCTIKKMKQKTISNIINKNIHNQSNLHTDKWKGYSDASLYVKEHKTVNHSIGYSYHNTQVHTNTIEELGLR